MTGTIDDEINSLKAFCNVIDAVGKLKRKLQLLSDVTRAPFNDKLENEFFFYDILDGSWKHDALNAWVEVMLTDDINLTMTSHEMKNVMVRYSNANELKPREKRKECSTCNI